MERIRSFIGLLYRWANSFAGMFDGLGRVIFLSRVSLLVIAATTTLLAVMPQGHDIGFTVSKQPIRYFLPVIFCSLICWLWVRVILNQEFGRPLDSDEGVEYPSDVPSDKMFRWISWVPRVVGTLPSVGAAYAVYFANKSSGGSEPGYLYVIIAIFVAVAVFAFVWQRRRIVKWILVKPSVVGQNGYDYKKLIAPKTTDSGDYANMSNGMKAALVSGWVVPLVALLPGLFWPARMGLMIGASAAVFISATFIASLLSTFVFAFNSSKKHQSGPQGEKSGYNFPVISVAVALSIVIPYYFDGDRFEVRKLAGENGIEPRPTLDAAIAAWFEANNNPNSPGEKVEMVIVSTAGGALRAALWTGTILGKLQDEVPGFDDKLFAISGVSGGSLGATEYMSALWESNKCAEVKCDGQNQGFEKRIQEGLSEDFLGPVMLGLISNDVGLIGLGVVSKDRAEALEGAWEQAWADSRNFEAELENPMAGDFLKLWPNLGTRSWPALFLNGTHQQLGSRIITSNIDSAGTFTESYDFFRLRPDPIAASTAVHNSARFSYISPSGEISEKNHIIDGGYFENYGAETALEIVRAVRKFDTENRIIIRVIQIVSDPLMKRKALGTTSTNSEGIIENRELKTMPLGQYTAPLQGLLKTREARGLHAAKRLKAEIENDTKIPGVYFLFNMGDDEETADTALNWFMPEFVRKNLIKLISEGNGTNKKAMDRLVACLEADPDAKQTKCGEG